jgi:MFS family permease
MRWPALWPGRRVPAVEPRSIGAPGERWTPEAELERPVPSQPQGLSRYLPRTFESFNDREFRWFYLAMLGQMGSMNMQMVVRGYLAYVLTGSYAILGLVGLAGALPMLGLSMFGGVVADRLPKRTVLQVGQVSNLVNALALAGLIFAGWMTIEWLLASALIQGIVMALTMPTRQSMIPDIVGMDRMMNAVSLNMAGMNSMRLFSPALGGFIVAAAGFEWAFLAMAALYVTAIFALLRVTWRPAAAPGEAGAGLGQIWKSSLADIWQGFGYIRRDRLMLTLLMVSFASSIFGMPYLFLLPGYVSDIFDGGGSEVGLLISVSAIGSLAGALVLASLPNRHRGLLLLGGTFILALGLFAFAMTSSYLVACVFIIVVGLGSAMRQALTQGLLHAYVENAYRGRVMAVFMMQFSMMQFGTFIIGIIAEIVGIQAAFAGLGVGLMAVTLVVFLFVPRIRQVQ